MAESPETSSYSASLDTWNTLTDKEDLSEASDLNKLKAAVAAIQTALGTIPEGSAASLKARLALALADNGAVQQGTSFPVSPAPVTGQQFYRTDTDQYAIYDGASWDIIGPGGMTIKSVTSPSAASVTSDITIEANKLYLVVAEFTHNTSAGNYVIRFQSDSGNNYDYFVRTDDMDSSSPASTVGSDEATNGIYVMGSNTVSATSPVSLHFYIDTKKKDSNSAFVHGKGLYKSTNYANTDFSGVYLADTTITSFEFVVSGGTMTGNIYLYELGLTV